MFNQVRNLGLKIIAVTAAVALPVVSFAQATTPATAMASAETEILALIAVAGGAMIAVALAGVGWAVGAKLIKRIGGKA